MKVNVSLQKYERGIVLFILLLHFFFVFSSSWNLSIPVDTHRTISAAYNFWTKGIVEPDVVTHVGYLIGLAGVFTGTDVMNGDEFGLMYLRAGNNKGILAFHEALDNNQMNQEFFTDVVQVRQDDNVRMILRVGYFIEAIISLLTALVVYVWARQAFGRKSGLVALLLYSFSPFMSAIVQGLHSDNPARFLSVLTFYLLWKFITSPSLKTLIFVGISLGFTLVAKVSTAYYPFLMLLLLLIAFYHHQTFSEKIRRIVPFRINSKLGALVASYVFLGIITLLVVNALYLFTGVFQPLNAYEEGPYEFRSNMFKGLRDSFLGSIPLPISSYYVLMVDYGKSISTDPESFLFYLGDVYKGNHPKSFYFISFLVKSTLPVLLLFILIHTLFAVLLLSKKGEKGQEIQFNLLFLFIIIYFIFFFTTFVTSIVSGLRHLSMLYPLLFIAISSILLIKIPYARIVKWAVFTLLVLHIIVYLFAYPFFIPYFNEFVGKNNGYLYFRDTNIDYHELYYHALKYKEEHPEVIFFPSCFVQKGKVTMSPNDLNFQRGSCYGWLKQFEPVDFIGNSWPVYDVEGQWVQDENGQVRFLPSSKMQPRKASVNSLLKILA